MRYKDFFSNLFERYAGSKKLRGIWYHGTSAKYLKSILSQGLIPNPKEKSWDVDPHATEASLDRTTYGGVYLTKNLLTAYSAAWRTAEKTNSNRLIVMVDLQPKSLIADEDSIANYFAHYPKSVALWAYKTIKYGTEYSETQKELNDERKRFALDVVQRIKSIKNIENPKLEIVLKNFIESDGYEAMVTRIAAYHDMSDYYNQSEWYRNWDYDKFNREDLPLPPSKIEGEHVFRKFIDKLTRTLKMIPRKSDTFSPTGRTLQPIRFAGSNKIICIIELIKQPDRSEKIKIHYGELPQDFLKQHQERIGLPKLV